MQDPYSLEPKRVTELVESIKEPKVIEELYAFGVLLFNETKEVRNRIESKAWTVLTWSLAIIGFAYTQASGLWGHKVISAFFIATTLLAVFAILCAFSAVKSRSRVLPSDQDWFENESFDCADELRLYHVRALHEIKRDLARLSTKKGRLLSWAETCIVVSGAMLACAVLINLLVHHP